MTLVIGFSELCEQISINAISKTSRRVLGLLPTFVLAGLAMAGLSGAPVITGVANAASNIPAGMPLAQGSIIVIYGTGLGPTSIVVASAAFQSTTLSGTSVTVTSGTTTVNAPLYYTSATQVAALLPSSVPAGTPANFTVTYNNQTSNSLGHGVAVNNVGIFTIDSSGQGPAIVTYSDYSLVSSTKPPSAVGQTRPAARPILAIRSSSGLRGWVRCRVTSSLAPVWGRI